MGAKGWAWVVGVSLCFLSAPSRSETIVVLSDFWYPYNGEPASEREGYMIDLLRGIAKSNGHSIDYRLLDWELALKRTEAGQDGDCVVGAIASDAPRHVRTAAPWGSSQNRLYAHTERMPSIPNLAALGRLRIGAVADYSYGDAVDALLAGHPDMVTRVKSSRKAFPSLAMRLVTKKVDVVIEDSNVADASIAEMKIRSIRPVSVDFLEADPIFVACTPNTRGRTLIAQFDAGLSQARQSGELEKILARYALKDWAVKSP